MDLTYSFILDNERLGIESEFFLSFLNKIIKIDLVVEKFQSLVELCRLFTKLLELDLVQVFFCLLVALICEVDNCLKDANAQMHALFD